MSAINLIQSFSYSPTFSFEDAIDAYDSGPDEAGSGVLYSHGCLVNNDNTPNCTAACQNPSLVFANLYTMQNCMVLASLGPTKPYANGSLIRRNHTISPHSETLLSDFSIHLRDPQFPSLASDVNTMISDCLQQYCNRNNNSCSPAYFCNVFDINLESSSYNDTGDYCYPYICDGYQSSHLNPDIGGIGV